MKWCICIYIFMIYIYIGDIFWGYLIYVFFFKDPYVLFFIYIYMGYVRDIFM